MPKMVGIYLFDDVEVLDFAGPYEVFSTASRMFRRSHPQTEGSFSVKLIATDSNLITTRGGMHVIPDFLSSNCPEINLLIVPGGMVERELNRKEVIAFIRSLSETADLVASVCTGAFILGKAGLLDGLKATTHWEDLDDLTEMFPELEVASDVRWVQQGNIITSAGISAGIDMSLQIVADLEGEELAVETARQMEYRWQQNP
jgi:transcriptional regulator GlxA family with amidase domain